ncbi:MAG: hypothetical protein V3U93_01660 [Alphaproteobacteria bacterium]
MADSNPLAGPRAKIKRAEHHVKDLAESVQAFRERNPNFVVSEIDPQTSAQIFKANIGENIPLCWSTMIGDCAHNLRTALDYTVSAAVTINRAQPTRRTGFPIGGSFNEYESDAIGKVKGASQKFARLVRRLNPYKGGHEAFWYIHELDRIDKHQTIIPVWAVLGTVKAIKTVGNVRTEMASIDLYEPVDDGTILLGTWPGSGYANVEFTFEIVFNKGQILEGKPVIPNLFQLVQFTDRVVNIFDRHIFSKRP